MINVNQHGPISTFIGACFAGTVAPAADSAAVIDAPGELLKISSLHGRKTCRSKGTPVARQRLRQKIPRFRKVVKPH